MSTKPQIPEGPVVIAQAFSLETAVQKVRVAEDAWNSRDLSARRLHSHRPKSRTAG